MSFFIQIKLWSLINKLAWARRSLRLVLLDAALLDCILNKLGTQLIHFILSRMVLAWRVVTYLLVSFYGRQLLARNGRVENLERDN